MRSIKNTVLLMISVYLVSIFVLMYISDKGKRYFERGQVWEGEDLYAPYDFAIEKDKDSLKREILQARKDVAPVYQVDTQIVATVNTKILEEIRLFQENVRLYQIADSAHQTSEAEQLNQVFFKTRYKNVSPHEYTHTLQDGWSENLQEKAKNLLDKVYQKGFLATTPDSFQHSTIALRLQPQLEKIIPKDSFLSETEIQPFVRQQLKRQLGMGKEAEKNLQLLQQIFIRELRPNYRFSDSLTKVEMQRVTQLISPVYGKISAKTALVLHGQVVTPEIANILSSYYRTRDNSLRSSMYRWELLGRFLVILLLSGVFLMYLAFNRQNIFFNPKKLGLVLSVMFLTLFLMVALLQVKIWENILVLKSSIYLAPACLVPIMMSSFFDSRTSSMCNMIIALYGAILVQNGAEYAFVQTVTGTTVVYSLRLLSKREHLFYTLLYIVLAYSISYLSFHFYTRSSWESVQWGTLVVFGLNVLITTFSYPLIYVFEKSFRVTSDLSYLELLDTNHPLLRELSSVAPGTFQHSLQVANLAEKAVAEIKGNVLLTHVGALYHDIGKIKNPMYFIENNRDGVNPHLKLSAMESAKLIIAHVSYGLELAQKYRLPQEVRDFIRSHHGTTRVEYFYRTYLNELAEYDAEKAEQIAQFFSYNGPKPETKETAVVMIADSVEAASRSLKKYSKEELTQLVNKIIDSKIQSKQFDNCNLTFNDLTKIRASLTEQLLHIYHTRIEYPADK